MVDVSNVVTYKRLVAAGNKDIYYEDLDVAAGTMTELDTSSGAIDTSDQLNMFEAYQKVFIVNGANLKVADFVNTKLTHGVLATAHAHGDILTQDQTGSNYAYMVVDFTNTAKTLTYGYAYYGGSATAFNATNAITGSGSGTGFTPTAVTVAPHWYDYTVYPGGASGALPNKAYLGCLYRGRCVLSGDPERPYQWYMSRQANPWDFAYFANDAQSPVAGGNADAGESGDIIRALIPYKDDYLIFGCATSMWFLAGDPAESGSLNELDLTVGMFGANSWCFDGQGSMYFWGTNGIYKTTIPGTPMCVSEQALPQLVSDEAADPSTHRITMAFDRTRTGILICVTKLSDGSNSNYFYDLKSEGFFPEIYPDECGPYSLFYYAANSGTYRDLLVGCKDGYIRKFDDSAKSDDVGITDEAIDSYVALGPLQIGDTPAKEGRITGMIFVPAGGATGGTQSDSSDVDCEIFTARSAEEVVEKLTATTRIPNFSRTVSAPGRNRGNSLRRKIRGVYGSVRLGNNTADETWGFEQLIVDATKSGRLK